MTEAPIEEVTTPPSLKRVIGDLVDLFHGYYVGELEYRLGSKGP